LGQTRCRAIGTCGSAARRPQLANFDFSAAFLTSLADDDQAARDATKPTLATFLAWFANQPNLPLFTDYGLGPKDVSSIRASWARGEVRIDMVSEAMVDGLAVAGTPERCREKLAQLIEAGITTAVFLAAPGPDFAKDLGSLYRNLIRDLV
jgi:alkanesulfonate monooxygenase SsuD/methylene tetrahydromethanopterin reductase-like flavin-dependent oxidoreductase (luciferase family)